MPLPAADPVVPLPGVDPWVEAALGELAQLPQVTRVGMAVVEGGGRRLLFTASDRARDRDGAHDWCHIDAFATAPLNDAIGSGDMVAGSLGGLDGRYGDFVAAQEGTGHQAVAAVPFAAQAPPLGGFVLYYSHTQAFDTAQHGDLLEIAARLEDGLRTTLRPGEVPSVAAAHDEVPGVRVAQHDMPPDPAAVGHARRFLRETLSGWSVEPTAADRAVLCLSELATNSLIHTGGGCHVRVELADGVLTTRVHDNGATAEPRVQASDASLHGHGHGLRLVEALVDSWGRTTDAHSAAVWFALAV